MRALSRLMAAGLVAGAAVFAQAEQLSRDAASDLAYRAALYQHRLGHYDQAHSRLMLAAQQDAGAQPLHRQALLAQIYVDSGQYQRAREAFESLAIDAVPEAVRNDVYYALARLYFAGQQCRDVQAVLDKTRKLQGQMDAHARFMLASCMVRDDYSASQGLEAEKILRDGLGRQAEGASLVWFAYAYFNLAVAVANAGDLEQANNWFSEALKYTGDDDEGRALYERIMLSRASVNYAQNRFDYAVNAYRQLPLDSLWQDEALLGYGWAAFRNYQSDVALESWRQLVNLPYKSMSVYQGYLAIPYALEKASALLQALEAYQYAIEQYTVVTDEIDAFSARLDLQKINDHAVHYYQNQGKFVEPLHPLLAATYVQEDFRALVEQIGYTSGEKEQLADYRDLLDMLSRYIRQHDAEAAGRQQWREQAERTLVQQIAEVNEQLDGLLENVMQAELAKENAPAAIAADYRRYQGLRRQLAGADGARAGRLRERLERLRGVLLMRLMDSGQPLENMQVLINLVSHYQLQLVRLHEYRQLTGQTFARLVDQSDFDALRSKIADAEKRADSVLLALQQQLLQRTRTALAEQRQLIEDYKNQARIANANLKEEFYQRGGSRLWQ